MKRTISLLLALLMGLGLLTACGDTSDGGTTQGDSSDVTVSSSQSQTDSASDSDTDGSQSASSDDESDVVVYDEEMDHFIIALETNHGSVKVLDLNRCNGDFQNLSNPNTVVWEMGGFNGGLSGVKYREAPDGEDVILLTSSNGEAWIVSYEEKEIIWSVDGIYNAHSIEMLPNGDVIVAASGNSEKNYIDGGLHYFPAGSTEEAAFLSFPFAHAAVWDPDKECVWTIGFDGIAAFEVIGSGDSATLSWVEGLGVEKENFSGHDFVPAYGQPGKYYVSDNESLYLFDSETGRFGVDFKRNTKAVKGIAYFADDTMVLAPGGMGEPSLPALTRLFRIYTTSEDSDFRPEKQDVTFRDWEFYKIHTFDKNYK